MALGQPKRQTHESPAPAHAETVYPSERCRVRTSWRQRLDASEAAGRNGKKRRKAHALFSARSIEWETPHALYRDLDAKFGFTLDVCAMPDNAKCARFFSRADNGLAQSWAGDGCWMNPPYGREIGRWVEKAYREAQAGALVVALLPVRTDTAWQRFVTKDAVEFLPGRLRFGGAESSAPFPSTVVVFRGPAA